MNAADHQLRAYFRRVGIEPPTGAPRETLEAVQRAHRFAVPFENLNIPLGRGVSLDPDDLFAKIVEQRRGGYCFEQNSLLLIVLRALGFDARPLLGRVWLAFAEEGVPPRTHTLNLVRLEGRDHIVDVGFGGSFAPILPLEEDAPVATPDGVRHRLVRDREHGWVLERDGGGGWMRQYSFTEEPVWPSDLDTANHWTATRPGTRFTTLRIVSMALDDGHVSLVDRTLTVSRRGFADARELETAEEYRRVLDDRFGLSFSAEEVAGLKLF